MAHDDMHVVMCKILGYLYKCMKAGEKPDMQMLTPEALGINALYYRSIIEELVDGGFVKGYRVTVLPSGARTITAERPEITREGVEFMEENSTMKRALAFLRDTKGAIPFL